jgi:CheY-like chemotaxis protein
MNVSRVPCSRPPPLRVLVVDDNVDGAEALCSLLASMGCTTAVAFDGAQGLATAWTFRPHLALIDLEMPDMSGCDVARLIRAGQPVQAARLVCLTGHGRPEDRRLCIEAGFDDFFTKPMVPERLLAVLAAAHAATHAAAGTTAPGPGSAVT